MPRSSRHKSSKHSSREVRDYSDSEKEREKESVSRDKKGRDDSRHLKESTTSSEKRKSESKSTDVNKDSNGGAVVIVDYADEYGASSSSKKRKEKEEDDRWTGGEWDGIDVSKSDSKRSSRREESAVTGFDGEEGKKSGVKAESKHHRSDRKERGEKEGGSERDRKSSKSERLGEGVTGNENLGSEGARKNGGGEDRAGKLGVHNNNNNNNNDKNKNNTEEDLRNPEPEREIDRRVKRKRDGLGDGDKHQDGARELDDRRLSRDEMSRSGKYKDEAHKDEKIRDRYQDTDSWHEDDKQRDNRATREYNSGRSEEKHPKSDKKDLEVSQKKSKAQGNEYDREADRERDRDRDHHDRERGRERDRDRERDRSRHERERDRDRDRVHDDRDRDLERDRDQERDPERIHNREPERERERGRDRYHRERDRERIRDREHNHDRSRDRDYDHDHDYASHVDDKGSKYKDDRGRRRSPDVYDDYYGDKSKRVELEADKDRSLSRKARFDNFMSNSRRKASPSSRTYASTDKYRDGIQDETKNGDSLRDGVASEIHDKVPKYRSGEKRTKFDENYVGELSERSPSTKASPAGLKERSPSASIDRRFQNRTTRRRSLDVDEAERKSSGSKDIRDAPFNEDRQVRELSAKKPSGEEYSRAESPFHHKSSHGNMSSHGPGSLGFRSGTDSPSYMGSLGDDSRGLSGSRFRRSVDPNVGRGPGNAWKGASNWPSPLPNGFLPFPPGPPGPHGPHHGGFPTMLPQFPPIFGVRPSMDINHPGMPYHMGDGDRFPANVRSMGWQNMVDGPVPPHFHGWDVSNSLLRDEPGVYGPGHPANAHRRDMNAEMWKSNGDVNLEFTSVSQKESQTVKASMDEVSSAQGASKPHVENSCFEEGASKMNTPSGPSSTKDIPMTPAKAITDKTPESSSIDDTSNSVRVYLAKLDISMDMTDPDLYNQFINLALKGEPEYVEEVEFEYNEDKAVFKSEIRDLTLGLTFSPTVKDSIFQKAMDLYKRQSANRSSPIPEGDKLRSHPTSHQGVEQTSVLDEKADNIVELGAKKEEPSLVVPEGISTTPVLKGKGDDALNDGPLPSSELAHGLGGQVLAPVITEKMDEDDVDKGLLSVVNAHSDANELNTDPEIVSNNGKRGSGLGGGSKPISKEPLNTGVSGDLVSRDSVKVCEALNLVSNESHTGILSRIHNAPESTH